MTLVRCRSIAFYFIKNNRSSLRIVGSGFCPTVRGLPRAMLAPDTSVRKVEKTISQKFDSTPTCIKTSAPECKQIILPFVCNKKCDIMKYSIAILFLSK